MRLLFLSNGYPPQRWAGTETYTAGIAEELQRRGHSVQVLCAGAWEEGPANLNGHSDDCYNSVAVRRLILNWQRAPDPFGYLYNNPVIARYLARYLEDCRPDVVHVTSCENLSASVLRVVKDANLPLVLTLTDFWFLCPHISLLRSDGDNCSGLTTPWECLRCQLAGTRAYHWPAAVLPEAALRPLLSTLSRYPLVTRQRGLRGPAGDMGRRKQFLSQAINWPDVRLTASPFVQAVFAANHVQVPIRVQPYGHDLRWLSGFDRKSEAGRLRVGFIGQISPKKGLHLLVEAVAALGDSDQARVSLSVYGDMRHDPGYSRRVLAVAAGRENIRFCGTVAHEKIGAVFSELDVLVVPSLWYDFPLVIHEAFATKTPVIATDLGDMALAIRPEVDGLLFGRGDANDLSQKLKRFIDDPQLLARLRAGIAPVKTIAQSVDELEQIYDESRSHVHHTLEVS